MIKRYNYDKIKKDTLLKPTTIVSNTMPLNFTTKLFMAGRKKIFQTLTPIWQRLYCLG